MSFRRRLPEAWFTAPDPEGKKGTMRKRNHNLLFWMAVICILCCGCGKKESTLLIGEGMETALPKEAEEGASLPSREEEGSESSLIRVYVCGAVASPGVVEIPGGSRAEDALRAAGGFSQEAAREAVNLADWVNDGQKLYFPAQGEEISPENSGISDASPGLVNINTADAAGLCTLPGVGESRAADIIAWREANGGFDSCEDIMKVPGIKDAMYEKIKDKIAVK